MNYHNKKEPMSGFAKAMIGVTIVLIAVIAGVIIAFGGASSSSTASPKNFVNNALQFLTGGELQTAPAAEVDTLAPVPEEAGEGAPILTTFVDYACPHCQDFEAQAGGKIAEMLEDGTISELRVAPVAYQPTPYSGLAQMTMLCVAENEPSKAFDTHVALMEIGAEGGATEGTLMQQLGEVTGSEMTNETKICVKNNTFRPYADFQNMKAQEGGFFPLVSGGITGTPSIFINTDKYSGDPNPMNLELSVQWVHAGGTLAEITANPAVLDDLDLTDPANPTIKK